MEINNMMNLGVPLSSSVGKIFPISLNGIYTGKLLNK